MFKYVYVNFGGCPEAHNKGERWFYALMHGWTTDTSITREALDELGKFVEAASAFGTDRTSLNLKVRLESGTDEELQALLGRIRALVPNCANVGEYSPTEAPEERLYPLSVGRWVA
jgi:hypothetical protein